MKKILVTILIVVFVVIVVTATMFDTPNLLRTYFVDKTGTAFVSKHIVDESA